MSSPESQRLEWERAASRPPRALIPIGIHATVNDTEQIPASHV